MSRSAFGDLLATRLPLAEPLTKHLSRPHPHVRSVPALAREHGNLVGRLCGATCAARPMRQALRGDIADDTTADRPEVTAS